MMRFNSYITWLRISALAMVALGPWSLHSATGASLLFTDITFQAGISYRHSSPVSEEEWDMTVGGAVAEDFNGDGWIDLYALQGRGRTNLMYINTGLGTFVNEAATRGTALAEYNYSGAAAADFDNDGDIDLCLTRLHANPVLLVNDGTGVFQADMEMLPVPSGNVMSPSWGDVDNDGFLELVVGQWAFRNQNLFLYRNRGGTQLEPYEFRLNPSNDSFVFSPRFADLNNDGLVDLPVAADFGYSQLFLNRGDGMFERVTSSHGVGTDENGMGSAIGDYDADGDLDWFVSSIYDGTQNPERNWGVTGNRLYRNRGDAVFEDATDEAGVRDGNWGWGSGFGDLDNDGDLDLYHVNGWPFADVITVPDKFNQQPARLFQNDGLGHFTDVAVTAGAGNPGQGRGMILFDFDNDGDLDIFIVNNQELQIDGIQPLRFPGPPALLRNDTPPSNHWLNVTLQGKPPLHRHGIGSRVYATIGNRTEMRELNASTGFLAHGPNRIAHFGLGTNQVASRVKAAWNSGDFVERYEIEANQILSMPSPTWNLTRREFLLHESIPLNVTSALPVGHHASWIIDGAPLANPSQISFANLGPQTVELWLYEGEESEPYQRETYRIQITLFKVLGIVESSENGMITLTWEASAGMRYQPQYCDHLAPPLWQDVGETITATEHGSLSTSFPRPSHQGFYRIKLLGNDEP